MTSPGHIGVVPQFDREVSIILRVTKLLTMEGPRWLGWVLAISGSLLTIMMTFIVVVIALFADEPWGDVAGDLFAFWFIGVLAALAGIRILRGTSRRKAAGPTSSRH